MSDTYDQSAVRYFSVFGARLVDVAGLAAGEQVLDVGCGRGAVTMPAARAVGESGQVTAIDLAPGMVARLTADLAASGVTNVEVRLMDAQHPDLPAAAYDAILASLVVFFLPDPAAALTRYHALLRPGGRVAITTFGGDDERWTWLEDLQREFLPTREPMRPPGAGLFATTEKVDGIVSGAGFVDVRSVVETHDVWFRDAQQWWDWSWSHGARAFWDRVPADRVDECRAAAFAQLSRIAEADGSLVLHQPIRYTTGWVTAAR